MKAAFGVDTGQPGSQRLARPWRQILLSLAIGSIVAWLFWALSPGELPRSTDIIGYPIFADFNVERYLALYRAVVFVFPIASIIAYAAVCRRARRGLAASDSQPSPIEPQELPRSALAAEAKLAFPGLVLGFAVAVMTGSGPGWVWRIGLPIAAGYAVVVLGVAAVAMRRLTAAPHAVRSAVNAVFMPFLILAWFAATASTKITVLSTGATRDLSWIPPWLAGALFIGILAATIYFLRNRRPALWYLVERWLVLLVAAPIAIFLFASWLPGATGGMLDFFHSGEPLGAATLISDGAFPWRDVYFIHGLAKDPGLPLVARELFEFSLWGLSAMTTVVLVPTLIIANYYLMVYLFRSNWPFLVASQLAVILAVVYEFDMTWALVPAVLIMLGMVLDRPSWLRCGGLATLLVAQVVLIPEGAYIFVAAVLAVVGYDIYGYGRGLPFVVNFQRTLRCLSVGLAASGAWALFLVTQGALDDFVNYYIIFARDHELTGGIPVQWASVRFWIWLYAPPALAVVWFLYLGYRVGTKRKITVPDWTMGAAALAVALSYTKALSRADSHTAQIFSLAIPLLLYVGFKILSAFDRRILRTRLGAGAGRYLTRFPSSLVLLVLVVAFAPVSALTRVDNAASRLETTTAEPPQNPLVGYAIDGFFDPDSVTDMETVLDAVLDPDDPVMDFTNSPALFHFLLDRPSASRYFHISMAIREDSQEDVIEDLQATQPKLVFFGSRFAGLPEWDGVPNAVRHYDVSRYILTNYRPLAELYGYLIMERSDLDLRSRLDEVSADLIGTPGYGDLYFSTRPCDWGFALEHLRIDDTISQARAVSFEDASGEAHFGGWAADLPAGQPAPQVVVADQGQVVAETTPSRLRQDVAVALGNDALALTGFDVRAQVASPEEASRLRVYAIQRDGSAIELSYANTAEITQSPAVTLDRLINRDGSIIPVGVGAAGWVDIAVMPEASSTRVLQLALPEDFRDYRSVEIKFADPGVQANRFELTNGLAAPAQYSIGFSTSTSGLSTYRVPVGSCSQWYGYDADRVLLLMQQPAQIAAIRLVN